MTWDPPSLPPVPPPTPTPPPPPSPLGPGPWSTPPWPGPPIPPARPPRPAVPVAGGLLVLGAVIIMIGCFLPWLTVDTEAPLFGIPRRWNGFTEVNGEIRDGPFFAAIAVVLVGFGITILLAHRLLPILVIGLIVALGGVAAGVADLADVLDDEGFGLIRTEVGPGLPVVIAGGAIAAAGCVAGLARRRDVSRQR